MAQTGRGCDEVICGQKESSETPRTENCLLKGYAVNARRQILRAAAASLALSSGCNSRSHNTQTRPASTSGTRDKYTLVVDPSQSGNINENKLRRATERAIDLFESKIALLKEKIAVAVGNGGCLRTGYNFSQKQINYCANTNTPQSGTASEDVVHHEMFHAMLCQIKPEWCEADFLSNDSNVSLHEGLADTFAHHLESDDLFGEGFYNNAPYVRKYKSGECYNLVEGVHQKGNTVASLLIGSKFELIRMAAFFSGSTFTLDALVGSDLDRCFKQDGPQLAVVPENYPFSALERYRIQKDLPLLLNFNPNDALKARFPTFKVRWDTAPTLFSIEESTSVGGAQKFAVRVTGETGWEEVTAVYEENGAAVGSESFYFVIKK